VVVDVMVKGGELDLAVVEVGN